MERVAVKLVITLEGKDAAVLKAASQVAEWAEAGGFTAAVTMLEEKTAAVATEPASGAEKAPTAEPVSCTPLAELDLPVRRYNALTLHGKINTVEELVAKTAAEVIEDCRNLGPKGVDEIRAALGVRSLALAGELPRRPIPPNTMTQPIEDLDLTVTAYNCLKRASINFVGQLLERSSADLLALEKKFNDAALASVEGRLHNWGLKLQPSS